MLTPPVSMAEKRLALKQKQTNKQHGRHFHVWAQAAVMRAVGRSALHNRTLEVACSRSRQLPVFK